MLVELEQLRDFLPLFRLHLFEDGVRLLFGQLGKQIGGRAGIHLFDDVGDALFVELFQQSLLQLGLHLLQGLGRHFFIERGEHRFALGGRQVFQNFGQVRGMHLAPAARARCAASPAAPDPPRSHRQTATECRGP